MTLLRVALGLVYVWFGALKIFGVSPAADAVAKTLFFVPPHIAVTSMGTVEVIIGIALIANLFLRATLVLFFAHMLGTFLTMVVRPDMTFQHGNPLWLTSLGEFIVKNLVFLAAGAALWGQEGKRQAR